MKYAYNANLIKKETFLSKRKNLIFCKSIFERDNTATDKLLVVVLVLGIVLIVVAAK